MMTKIGCSGFQEARSKYYQEFPVVEIQQTFFQPPSVGTAYKWRSQAPENFEFTIKAWQLITHEPVAGGYRNLRDRFSSRALSSCGNFKSTKMVIDAWRRTEAVANALQARIIVFQTPKTFRSSPYNIRNFKNFFRRINRRKYTIVWEPGSRWPLDTVMQLCHELGLVYTANPRDNNPVSLGPIQYFRLKGKNGYRSRYDEKDFEKLLNLNSDKPSYFIFNNASMLFDARNFLSIKVQFEKSLKTAEIESLKKPESVTAPVNDAEVMPETLASAETTKTPESGTVAAGENPSIQETGTNNPATDKSNGKTTPKPAKKTAKILS